MKVTFLLSILVAWNLMAFAADEKETAADAAADGTQPVNDGKDKYPVCVSWAEAGECETNPKYMLDNCPESCASAKEHREATLKQVEKIKSIHELSANDIDGNEIKFSDMKGSVIVFVNIALHDPLLTKRNFQELLELHEKVKEYDVNFLLFPCSQFGKGESSDPDEIKAFVTNKGLLDDGMKFTLMKEIKVNGPDAHIVYKFAKYDAVPAIKTIAWNFDPYFIVHPSGELEARPRTPPSQLFEPIAEHFVASTEL